MRHGVFALVAGAAFGLALFLAEAILILQGEAAGLKIDLRGPIAAVFPVVKPLLPGLFGRIVVVYLAAGAVLGFVAFVLTWATGVHARWLRRTVFVAEWWAVATVWAWWKAILRPALFDDLAWLRPALRWVVDHGQPWHPLAVAGVGAAVHLALAAWRVHDTAGLRFTAWRLRWVGVGALATTGVAALAVVTVTPPAPSKPLVVLIGIDAFRPDRLKALGASGQVAPNVDRFVDEAVLFTRAYTPIAQTEPAWRSLLTARWPHVTGVRYPLTPEHRVVELPTFPALLAERGWTTAFFTDCSRFHYEDARSGFTVREQPPRGAINFLLEKLRFRAVGVVADHAVGAWWLPELIDNRAIAGIHDPHGYANRLADRWVELARQGPTLLAFHATAPHFPGDPSFPQYRRFVGRDEPLERRLRMVFSPIGQGGAGGWNRAGSEALYDELLAQADAQVGVLLDRLREAGLYDEATILLFSDHGESFHADFPALSGATPVHGARLSEEENRILLAVKPPRSTQSSVRNVDALVRLLDAAPTILEAAGAPALTGVDGESLLPLVRGEPSAPRRLYAETGFTHASPDAFDPEHRAGAMRAFEAYHVRSDGVVEMSDAAHGPTLAEKDVGAFDGTRWLIRAPRKDGSVLERCDGDCSELKTWLDEVIAQAPPQPVVASQTQHPEERR